MPPQHSYSIILGTSYQKMVSLPASESWMNPVGILTEWRNLQTIAQLVLFTTLCHRAFSMWWQSWKKWRSGGLPLILHFWAAGHSTTQTYQLRKSVIVPLQKPVSLPYALLRGNVTIFAGPTLLTRLSATPHRMLKLLRIKYFQLLKRSTWANLWIYILYYHHYI